MTASSQDIPVPFQIISDTQQLKAFSDPLRNRILHILAAQEATNQQLAVMLGESQAKVFHHVQFLLRADLIRLVRETVRGGNVEKFYRATARLYGLRPAPGEGTSLPGVAFEAVVQELMAAEQRWPDRLPDWEIRRVRLPAHKVDEFQKQLRTLIAEYWGGPEEPTVDDPAAPLMAFAAVTYRFPGEE